MMQGAAVAVATSLAKHRRRLDTSMSTNPKRVGVILAFNETYARAAAEVARAGYHPVQLRATRNVSTHRCNPQGGYIARLMNIHDVIWSALPYILQQRLPVALFEDDVVFATNRSELD